MSTILKIVFAERPSYDPSYGSTVDGLDLQFITNFSCHSLPIYEEAIHTFPEAWTFGISEIAYGFCEDDGRSWPEPECRGLYISGFNGDTSLFFDHLNETRKRLGYPSI